MLTQTDPDAADHYRWLAAKCQLDSQTQLVVQRPLSRSMGDDLGYQDGDEDAEVRLRYVLDCFYQWAS